MQHSKRSLTLVLASVLSLVAACGGDGDGGNGEPTAKPRITLQPRSLSVVAGQPAQFSVEATGAPPLSYRWMRNGTAVEGATSQTLTTLPALEEDSGLRFSAVVTNPAGSVTSEEAVLTVTPAPVAPVIQTAPAAATVFVDEAATFAVVATGTAPLSYQWTVNGAVLAGATGASFTTGPARLADSGLRYGVTVENGQGRVSAEAQLTVLARPPVILQEPSNTSAAVGQPAVFSVVADGTPPLQYQWHRNGTAIAGATGDRLTLTPNRGDTGSQYFVQIVGPGGSVRSRSATLTVLF